MAAAVEENEPDVIDRLLDKSDVWVEHIFPFLGIGHFAFVAGACKQMKEHYVEFVGKTKCPEKIMNVGTGNKNKFKPSHTFLKHAFATVGCAEYFHKSRKHGLKLLLSYKQILIAKYGTVEVMKSLRGNRKIWKWDDSICEVAAERGNFEMVKYAHQQGCGWFATAANSAEAGRLDILQYARGNGCDWDEEIVNNAARNGFIDILAYALENGCTNHKMGMWAACNGGQIEVIEYLLGKGVQMGTTMAYAAAYPGRFEALKYLRDRGCPWDYDQVCRGALWSGNRELMEWLDNRPEHEKQEGTGYFSDDDSIS